MRGPVKFLSVAILGAAGFASFPQSGLAQQVEDGISVSAIKSSSYKLYIKGNIREGDAAVVEQIFREAAADGSSLETYLIDSAGGSVPDAIAIGSMIRAWDGTVILRGYCYSSCALIYAGGSIRFHSMDSSIGLHRPYFAVQAGGTSPTTQQVSALFAEVDSFLRAMNITPRVHDAMMKAEPEEMTVLDGDEIDDWFPMTDPVYDEVSTSNHARRYGIGTLEYRQIDAMDVDWNCEAFALYSDERSICRLRTSETLRWGLSASKQAQIENLTKAASEACSIGAPARERIEAAVMMGRLAALESLSPDPIRELRSMPEILNNYDCIIAKIRP